MFRHFKEALHEFDGLPQALLALSLVSLLLWGMLSGQARSAGGRYASSLQLEAGIGLVTL